MPVHYCSRTKRMSTAYQPKIQTFHLVFFLLFFFLALPVLCKMKLSHLCFCLHRLLLCLRTWMKLNKTWLASCHLWEDGPGMGKEIDTSQKSHLCLFFSVDIKGEENAYVHIEEAWTYISPMWDLVWQQVEKVDYSFLPATTLLLSPWSVVP